MSISARHVGELIDAVASEEPVPVLLACAALIDAGCDVRVLADMMASPDRFTDSEIPVPDGSSAAELRAFYASWRPELAA